MVGPWNGPGQLGVGSDKRDNREPEIGHEWHVAKELWSKWNVKIELGVIEP